MNMQHDSPHGHAKHQQQGGSSGKLRGTPSRFGAALLLLSTLTDAQAYVDPGSGMLLWQGLLAAIGAVLVFVRKPWQVIKQVVSRTIGRNERP
jgi:hypothetical protein